MEEADNTATTIREFLQMVADEFKHSQRGKVEAVLEPEDAGDSFEHDLVQAKFRVRKGRDWNAVGVIVTADEDDAVPGVSHVDVAKAIAQRLDAIGETRKGSVARLEYLRVPLDEIVVAIGHGGR